MTYNMSSRTLNQTMPIPFSGWQRVLGSVIICPAETGAKSDTNHHAVWWLCHFRSLGDSTFTICSNLAQQQTRNPKTIESLTTTVAVVFSPTILIILLETLPLAADKRPLIKICDEIHCLHSLLSPATNYSLKHCPTGHPFELQYYSYNLSHKISNMLAWV